MNWVLVGVSVVVTLVIVEVLGRSFFPIQPAPTYISTNGDRITIVDPQNRHRLYPNLKFLHVSSEFSAMISTTPLGYRTPSRAGAPHIVFLGDSFTFGHGLSDDETFAFLFCRDLSERCANLGRPGSGTIAQLDQLEHFLKVERWQPYWVYLFMFAMSENFSSGNDFVDNIKEYQAPAYRRRDGDGGPEHDLDASGGLTASLVNGLREAVARSNTARIVQYYFGPYLRSLFSPSLQDEVKRTAYDITRTQLVRLAKLSDQYQFDYRIFVIHPVQDILRATDAKTLEIITNLSSRKDVVFGTAQLFSDDPISFYYQYDGHLNAAGARAIAAYLVKDHDPSSSRRGGSND